VYETSRFLRVKGELIEVAQTGQKVALVTGASSGIGKATAKRLLKDGYIVYAAARRLERMEDLAKLGGIPLRMDVTSEADLQAVLQQIESNHGGVDVLVNNAGFATYGAVEDTTMEDARYQFDVNVFGLARITQLVLPHMREQRFGKIVNISSMGGRIYTPFGAWYHATKHALEGWSDCLRYEVAPFGIDVIIIEPGGIETEFGDVMLEPMLKRSEGGPYRAQIQGMADAAQRMVERGSAGSPPSLIANVVGKSLRARRPRTRYVAGSMARPMLFIRRWFGDRVFDWTLRRVMG
jgi:NAD(P)-dependent dehydrogenase (short-subunit alcohol dehydrogenase family)